MGPGEEGVLDSVEVYDPASGLLSQAARLPARRGLHTATTINGVVYLAGGLSGDWQFATDILQLDPKTLTFPGDAEANRMLTRPQYRAPYIVPEKV